MGSNETIEAIVNNKEIRKEAHKTMVATRIPPIIFLKMFPWLLMMENIKTLTKSVVTTRTLNLKFLKMLLLFVMKTIFMLNVESWSMKTALAR